MRKHLLKPVLAAFFLIVVFHTLAYADVDKLSISQIHQNGNEICLYVNALQDDGTAVTDQLEGTRFSVTIDKSTSITPERVSLFKANADGISYIFCIDISKSVTESEMQEIRSSIASFIERMGANDYGRIITIGTEITEACKFTQDKNELITAAQGIQRTANYTFLYQGLSYALDGQRKKFENMPERAVIVVFTDGMDDSDGASSMDGVSEDIVDVRVPIYVVGLKGNDSSANLGSVGMIARQSGGELYSYNSMSIGEALQAIGDVVDNTYQLYLRPDTSFFGKRDIQWTAEYNSGNYTTSSKSYMYSLSMDNVVIATDTPVPVDTPTPVPVDSPTPTPMPPIDETVDGESGSGSSAASEEAEGTGETDAKSQDKEELTFWEKVLQFVKDYLFFIIAILLAVIALIIVIIILVHNKRKKGYDDDYDSNPRPYLNDPWGEDADGKTELMGSHPDYPLDGVSGDAPYPYPGDIDSGYSTDGGYSTGGGYSGSGYSGSSGYSGGGGYSADGGYSAGGGYGGYDGYGEEATVAEDRYGSALDNEETVDNAFNKGVRFQFAITFEGRTETIEKVLYDKIKLGRGSEKCDIDVVLGSGSEARKHTSRLHATILNRPDGIYIRDEGSNNKTFVNGAEVVGEMPLKNDDMLQLGDAMVRVRILEV